MEVISMTEEQYNVLNELLESILETLGRIEAAMGSLTDAVDPQTGRIMVQSVSDH